MDAVTTLRPGVAGRFLFYNSSSLGRNDPGANLQDGAAIVEKQALRPGQRAAFANVGSDGRGINGSAPVKSPPGRRINHR